MVHNFSIVFLHYRTSLQEYKRGLKTRWSSSIILFCLYCLEQLPFNGVDDIADEVLSPGPTLPHINDAFIGWSFSDRTVDVQWTRCLVQHMLLRYRVTQTVLAPPAAPVGVIHLTVDPHDDGMLSLEDPSDSDEEPYVSDSDSETDDGMPPLIELSDSDSGYGSD
ncbi:hypothetical protein C8J56DRAFT_886192 [Mycena floridula]|nr:hypothetical protein C8J56DRAFT_886192 [Mycena floridula]